MKLKPSKYYLDSTDKRFTIFGDVISGLQSIDASYTIPMENSAAIGNRGGISKIQNGFGKGNISFSKKMLTCDKNITDYIGSKDYIYGSLEFLPFDLNPVYDDLIDDYTYEPADFGDEQNPIIKFDSGIIESYTCSFTVDSLPETSVNMAIYGDMGKTAKIPTENPPKEPATTVDFIPFSSGISLVCDGRESNHVSSFTLTIITAHQPYYKIGSLNPCDIIPIKPVKQNFNVDIDIIDYQTRSLHDYIKTGIHVKNLSVKMRDKCDPDKYCTFEFPNSYLVSENVSVDSQNNTKAKLSYECLTIDKPIINYYGFPDGS
jgi:hypothetical protein